jgi:hypothetical protein
MNEAILELKVGLLEDKAAILNQLYVNYKEEYLRALNLIDLLFAENRRLKDSKANIFVTLSNDENA